MTWTNLYKFDFIYYYLLLSIRFLCYCFVDCSLACWSFSNGCFVFENFFIVWTFKLWRKGGQIGLGMLRGGFSLPLVLCLVFVASPSCLACFFCVLWCFFWNLSIPILVAASFESRCLNFYVIQLSHFFK